MVLAAYLCLVVSGVVKLVDLTFRARHVYWESLADISGYAFLTCIVLLLTAILRGLSAQRQ